MEFKSASIAGMEFHIDNVDKLHDVLQTEDSRADMIREFLTHLAVCHSFIPQPGKTTELIVGKSNEYYLKNCSKKLFKTRMQVGFG
jgi:hypothetical protein